jgi:hypothetical protein
MIGEISLKSRRSGETAAQVMEMAKELAAFLPVHIMTANPDRDELTRYIKPLKEHFGIDVTCTPSFRAVTEQLIIGSNPFELSTVPITAGYVISGYILTNAADINYSFHPHENF